MSTSSLHAPFQCPDCSSSFGRLEHFQRHCLSHTNIRPFQCTFCIQSFNRRDALTRHWKICKSRLSTGEDIPTLPKKKKGKKKASCDRCSQLKRACSRTLPCRSCHDRKQECQYSGLDRDPSSFKDGGLEAAFPSGSFRAAPSALHPTCSVPPFQPVLHSADLGFQQLDVGAPMFPGAPSVASDSFVSNLSHLEQHDGLYPVHELCNHALQDWKPSFAPCAPVFSSAGPSAYPTHGDESRRYDYLDHTAVTRGIMSPFHSPPPGEDGSRRSSLQDNSYDSFESCEEDDGVTAGQRVADLTEDELEDELLPQLVGADSDTSASSDASVALSDPLLLNVPGPFWFPHVLDDRGADIVHSLHRIVEMKGKKSPISIRWSARIQARCYRFFSGSNIDSFLQLYWQCWHTSWPAIHKVTFDPLQAPAPLLAAMVVMGACYSTSQTSRIEAALWFEALEEWVFQQDEMMEGFVTAAYSSSRGSNIQKRLDALRSAYLVVNFQNWEGSERAQKRVRESRYAQIVMVASEMSKYASHGDLDDYLDVMALPENWNRFILIEGLTRTITYVYILDSAYSILHDTTRRLKSEHADFDLTSPDECFEAPDIQMWWKEMEAWTHSPIGQRQLSLHDATLLLSSETVDEDDQLVLSQFSMLNMFAITNVVHGIISSMRTHSPFLDYQSPLKHCLENWRKVYAIHNHMGRLNKSNVGYEASIGFMRHAPEYCGLALAMLQAMDANPGHSKKIPRQIIPSFEKMTLGPVM